MLWVLAFHVIFVVCWFAGLFYLPRLFVYHAQADDAQGIKRFKIMELKLFWGIMTPSGILASLFGLWYLFQFWSGYASQTWMHWKLAFVALLWIYHVLCWKLMYTFKCDKNRFSHNFYRIFNEVPTVILIVIVILAVVKP